MKKKNSLFLVMLCFTLFNLSSKNQNIEEILTKVHQDKVKFVNLEFTDILGSLKAIEIPVECLQSAIESGVWFDGSSITGFADIEESDMLLKPDLSTYATFPIQNDEFKTARFICNIYGSDGKLFLGDPRNILKKVVQEAKDLGFEFKVGPELEFYILKKENDKIIVPEADKSSYFDCNPQNLSTQIRKEIASTIKSFGLEPEKTHHEVGQGQHEVNFKYSDPLKTAENMITLKQTIRTIVQKYDLIASFMPKPVFRKAGSGMHVNFSLLDPNGNNLFFDQTDKHKLSPLAKQFIAGQLTFVKDMSAILNPTINSYRRLILGYESPVYICWARGNRSTLIRVPRSIKGKENLIRAELRCPDPTANPYLVFAAMLKAGLEGIKRNLPLPTEMEENVYYKTEQELKDVGIEILPRSLEQALEFFKKSMLMQELLGKKLFNEYSKIKEKELEKFNNYVTNWEIKKYLEM